MQKFFDLYENDLSIQTLLDRFENPRHGKILVTGISGTQKTSVISKAHRESQIAIVTQDSKSLADWKRDLESFNSNLEIVELPEIDLAEFNATSRSLEISARRMEILSRLSRGENLIILAKISAAIQKGISRQKFDELSLKIFPRMQVDREKFLNQLIALGYESSLEVERAGEFSPRGGIIDIFPVNSTTPLRIEFFDDEIDSIRQFDLATRRSIKNLDSTTIFPLDQKDFREVSFLNFLGKNSIAIFDEPNRLQDSINALNRESRELKSSRIEFQELVREFDGLEIFISQLSTKLPEIKLTEKIHIAATDMTPFQNQLDLFADELKLWRNQNRNVFLILPTQDRIDSTQKILERAGISTDQIRFEIGNFVTGFEFPNAKISVVTEKDLFGHSKHRTISRRVKGEKISSFEEIRAGDYVVHLTHGIGKYLGVETLEVSGLHKDYLKIQFAGTDKLFLPPEQISSLQKYLGGDGKIPRLSKMGGSEWNRQKSKTQAAVEEIAEKLLKIYAVRSSETGFAFSKDNESQREFEDAFPFEETPDQLQAIAEIKRDMESPKPMDRLLVGDVGFGKTEVAIRAAYKAVLDGKQVAVLVPTTVLAQQHFQTFTERFKNFLPIVEMISRFRTPREQKEILERVENGQVDILIGTHGVLNTNRVHFHDLGLLILDEEHRFGVKQKEIFKSVESTIDVLTLSATPIPRTLNMSLVGARDMSVIETPPVERFPVQTYVIENNDEIIRNAIRRELQRGGQVYFIYTRIDTIDLMRQKILELVPEAKIQTAHGQMNESLLEQVMLDFYNGEFDILLSTSIVENGLDIANANTIIIYNADQFGLSQLYQMRGRVGRSNRMAFAYLVYQAEKSLTENAERRLETMKDFAQLGAGFKIAMRDLEIRGAGNILGAQQHGHIASVGYATYCKLLEEAIEKLQTGKEKIEIDELPKDPQISLNIEAYIDESYINDDAHKFEIYQRLSIVKTESELQDLIDELIDRFGEPTQFVKNLLEIVRIKNLARPIKILAISDSNGAIDFTLEDRLAISIDAISDLQQQFPHEVEMIPRENLLRVKYKYSERKNLLNRIEKILKILQA